MFIDGECKLTWQHVHGLFIDLTKRLLSLNERDRVRARPEVLGETHQEKV